MSPDLSRFAVLDVDDLDNVVLTLLARALSADRSERDGVVIVGKDVVQLDTGRAPGEQWQRIAVARGFYRSAPLLIMDEPTAALDARAESALFSSVRKHAQGRTVLIITHRPASVRHADLYTLQASQYDTVAGPARPGQPGPADTGTSLRQEHS